MLRAAKLIAQSGVAIFPCVPTGDKAKRPCTQHGHHDATTDIAQIKSWWTQWPNAMIGMPIPDDLLVFDIDPRNGGSLEALEAVLGPLPPTLTTVSGRNDGGVHLWFERPAGNLSLRKIQGIDFKLNGYVIAPPSLHPATGKPYVWGDVAVEAELPKQAIQALQPPPAPTVSLQAPAPTGGSLSGLVRSVSEAVEGERNQKLYWAACRAFDHGDDEVIQDLFAAALSVGLTESEATATINSARRAERQRPEPYRAIAPIVGATPMQVSRDRSEPGVTNVTPEPKSDAELLAGAETATESPEATWQPVNLTDYVDGTFQPAKPSLLARTDGVCLLYPEKVHSLNGESESGKSMLALTEASEQLKNGRRVLFLDYESDPATVVDRLLKMGTPKDQINALLDYVQPEVDPVTSTVHELQQWQHILSQQYSLAVLDGVTEALGTCNASSMDNDEVAHWIRKVPRAIADKTGAATLLIDHVTKSRETRGRFAIGAQAKLASLSGASYIVEPVEPLGVGIKGRLQVKVAKDRPGQVRPHSVGWDKADRMAVIAEVIIDSTNPAVIHYQIEAPTAPPTPADADAELKEKIITSIKALQKVSPPSWNKIRADVSGNNDSKKQALNELIADGKVTVTTGPRNSNLHTIPD